MRPLTEMVKDLAGLPRDARRAKLAEMRKVLAKDNSPAVVDTAMEELQKVIRSSRKVQ